MHHKYNKHTLIVIYYIFIYRYTPLYTNRNVIQVNLFLRCIVCVEYNLFTYLNKKIKIITYNTLGLCKKTEEELIKFIQH